MKNFKPFIGKTSTVFVDRIDEALFEDFSETVKDPAGHPPTIWTRCRMGEFELVSAMGLQLSQILHAEQEYEFFEDCTPGFDYRYTTTLADVVEKKSKGMRLHFLVFESAIFRASDNRRCAFARSTMVHREPEVTT